MVFWYIVAGLWTVFGWCWTSAWLGSNDSVTDPSRLERFIRSKESLVSLYKREDDRI